MNSPRTVAITASFALLFIPQIGFAQAGPGGKATDTAGNASRATSAATAAGNAASKAGNVAQAAGNASTAAGNAARAAGNAAAVAQSGSGTAQRAAVASHKGPVNAANAAQIGAANNRLGVAPIMEGADLGALARQIRTAAFESKAEALAMVRAKTAGLCEAAQVQNQTRTQTQDHSRLQTQSQTQARLQTQVETKTGTQIQTRTQTQEAASAALSEQGPGGSLTQLREAQRSFTEAMQSAQNCDAASWTRSREELAKRLETLMAAAKRTHTNTPGGNP